MTLIKNFYCFGVCHVCKNSNLSLRKCSSCKTVYYCSKEHQIIDWKNHKSICKAITKTAQTVNRSNIFTYLDWINIRITYQRAWLKELNRPFFEFEHQMWMFPPACSVCYSNESLKICQKCHNAAYCSDQHMEQHKVSHGQVCAQLRLSLNVDKCMASQNSYPEIILKKQLDLTKQHPRDMKALMEILVGKCGTSTLEEVHYVLKADSIAPAATLLYVLNYLHNAEDVGPKLVIHIVGASKAEEAADWKIGTEILFHRFKNLRNISYIFIGPEVVIIPLTRIELCKSCRKRDNIFSVESHILLYHQIVDHIERPNLVIAFNCGLHEYQDEENDMWKNSLPSLIKNINVPLAFTSYTNREMQCDLDRITSIANMKVNVLLSGNNPFASVRPVRDWCTADSPIFYTNWLITIVKRVK